MTVYAVVPAAGRSRRMGQPKLLLPWTADEQATDEQATDEQATDEQATGEQASDSASRSPPSVIEAVLAAWEASRVDHVLVVARADDHDLHAACRSRKRCRLVIPATDPPEMRDSIEHALRFIDANLQPSNHDCWLMAPADMPNLTAGIINAVLDAAESDPDSIWMPRCGSRRGHPVCLPWSMSKEVFELPSDVGLNALFPSHDVQYFEMDDEGTLQDLDTPADYKRLRGNDANFPTDKSELDS